MTAATRLARLNAKALARFGAVHQLDGGDVQGDFVRPGKTFTLSDGMEMQARVPMLVVADGDVPAAPYGKAAVCEGGNYTVQEIRPDGHGLTVLELEGA
jgi:hypothetical protein